MRARGFALAPGALTLFLAATAVSLAQANGYDMWELSFLLGVAAAAIVGAFIISLRPQNRIGWFITLGALFFTLGEFGRQYATYALLTNAGRLPYGALAASLPYWIWSLGIIFMFVLAPLTFPDGRLPSARWRPVVPIMIAFILISSAYHAVQPGDFETPGIPNPLGITHLRVSPGMAVIVDFLSLFSWFAPMLVAATGLLIRYRRAGSEVRQQLKWFAFGVLLLIVSSVVNQATRAVDLPSAVRGLLLALPFSAMWLAIAIAILRYRLYDIDVIIRKTLVYSVLTAMLVAAYFVGVVLLQRLFQALTGRDQSQLVIVLSTLAIAALFQPLRRRVHGFIDRRFYRQRYNAQRTVERFAHTARNAVELEPVTAALFTVVEETLQPHSLTIWLKDSQDV